MRKRLTCLALSLVCLLALSLPAVAAEGDAIAVYVDGAVVTDARATVVEQTTYVSLYWVTAALRPDAVTAWADDRMVATAPDFTLSAKCGDPYLVVNGRYLYVEDTVRMHETGDTLMPVRALARALGATVSWDGTVQLTSGGTPLASGETFYNASDLDGLARVIYHESGNQPLAGRIAVGNVILNRVAHKSFPSTIYDVIHQPNQFYNATALPPDDGSILAAKLALDGAVTAGGAYWFNGADKPCWASRNKTLIATIGGHAFYG